MSFINILRQNNIEAIGPPYEPLFLCKSVAKDDSYKKFNFIVINNFEYFTKKQLINYLSYVNNIQLLDIIDNAINIEIRQKFIECENLNISNKYDKELMNNILENAKIINTICKQLIIEQKDLIKDYDRILNKYKNMVAIYNRNQKLNSEIIDYLNL